MGCHAVDRNLGILMHQSNTSHFGSVGVVKSTSYRQDGGAGTFVISVHPACSAHAGHACDGPCTKGDHAC